MRRKSLKELQTERQELLDDEIPFWLQRMTTSYISEGIWCTAGWTDTAGWSYYADDLLESRLLSWTKQFKKLDRRIRKVSGDTPTPWTTNVILQNQIRSLLENLRLERERINGLLSDNRRLHRLWDLKEREYRASLKCEICARPHTEITKLQFRKDGRRTRRVNLCYECLTSTLESGSAVLHSEAETVSAE